MPPAPAENRPALTRRAGYTPGPAQLVPEPISLTMQKPPRQHKAVVPPAQKAPAPPGGDKCVPRTEAAALYMKVLRALSSADLVEPFQGDERIWAYCPGRPKSVEWGVSSVEVFNEALGHYRAWLLEDGLTEGDLEDEVLAGPGPAGSRHGPTKMATTAMLFVILGLKRCTPGHHLPWLSPAEYAPVYGQLSVSTASTGTPAQARVRGAAVDMVAHLAKRAKALSALGASPGDQQGKPQPSAAPPHASLFGGGLPVQRGLGTHAPAKLEAWIQASRAFRLRGVAGPLGDDVGGLNEVYADDKGGERALRVVKARRGPIRDKPHAGRCWGAVEQGFAGYRPQFERELRGLRRTLNKVHTHGGLAVMVACGDVMIDRAQGGCRRPRELADGGHDLSGLPSVGGLHRLVFDHDAELCHDLQQAVRAMNPLGSPTSAGGRGGGKAGGRGGGKAGGGPRQRPPARQWGCSGESPNAVAAGAKPKSTTLGARGDTCHGCSSGGPCCWYDPVTGRCPHKHGAAATGASGDEGGPAAPAGRGARKGK